MANGTPLSLIVCLARVMRRVIVASGTRNARAISAVVRPPTARRVSAICDAGDSAGWQHMNSRISVSSASDGRPGRRAGASHCSGSTRRATVSSRRCRACSLRSRSVSRREATVISQAARVVRDAVGRPLRGGREQRLLDRVLGRVEMPVAPHHRAEDLRRQRAQQVLDRGVRHGGRLRAPARSGTSAIGRTSTYHSWQRRASGCGELDQPGGDLGRPVEALAVHDPVAGEHLLGLGVRPVGHHRHAVLAAGSAGRGPGRSGRGPRRARPDSIRSRC